jgi:serine/threonine protein kinase
MPAGEQVIVGLPPALSQTYTAIRELPNPGTEADVLLVRERGVTSPGGVADLKVVKIYRRGMHADQKVWDMVRTLRSDNIVHFIETGISAGRDYEVMEFLPGGNLTQFAAGRGGALPAQTVTEVVRQVAAGLEDLHRAGIVHRDLKPENVLVRQVQPLDIVVTDFGLSRAPEQSVVAASRTGTLAYLAPETLLSKGAHSSRARDWWALGMIVRELLTGVRPFEEMTESAIHQALMLRPIDLGDIDDPRMRLLCRGLVLRDPTDRWGGEQVRAWLAGGTPPVAEESAAEDGGIKPFMFEKVPYRERKALAKAFAKSWEQAARRYFVAMGTASSASIAWQTLREWLEQFRDAQADDVEGLYELIDDVLVSPSNPPDLKLLALIQWLDPDLPPVYRGQSLTPEMLSAIAERVAFDKDPGAELGRLVGDLHKYDLLPWLARMRGGSDLAELNAAWRELDGRFRQQAQTFAPRLPPEGRQVLADAGNSRRQAALLYVALDPAAHAAGLREYTTRAAGLLPAPVPWYDGIREHAGRHGDPVDDAIGITLFPLASRQSAATDQDRRHHEEAARRSQELWAERERRRLEGSPGNPRALAYCGAVAGAMLVLFIIAAAWTHSTVVDVLSALAGVAAAGVIAVSEVSLATQLGTDYPGYSPLAGAGGALRQAGGQINGAGRGCLVLIVGFFALGIAVAVPFVVYIVAGVVHMVFWHRRRSTWLARHEQERAQILGRSS